MFASRGAPASSTMTRLASPVALAFVAGAALALGGCTSVVNGNYYADDVKAEPVQGSGSGMLAKRILTGAGIIDPPAAPIAYVPRSPLAIPPSLNNLPSPESNEQLVASAQSWPNDPDKQKAAEAEAEATAPKAALASAMMDSEAARSTPEEMQAARIPGGGLVKGGPVSAAGSEARQAGRTLTPNEMASQKLNKPETADDGTVGIGASAERKYLVQPPTAYLQPAPNAPVPAYKKNVFQQYKSSTPEVNPTAKPQGGQSDQPEWVEDSSQSTSGTSATATQ